MEYNYDQLNRITKGLSLTNYTEGSGFATRDTETAAPYDAQYSYDANGNLLNLQRNNEASEIQDDFDYQYYAGTNKLRALAEGAPDAYIYDEIGNLVEDVEEGTTIEWTPYGKVRTVTKAAENLTINYRYDAAGNRVAKIVDKDGEVTTNRYFRDASGNVMAVYQDTLTLEHHIYGSSRLGLALEKSRPGQLKLGHRQYELCNHLGNVLAVITDNVNMVNSTENSEWYESKAWPTLVKTNDYYPFGLAMGGRTSGFSENDSVAYRYGFNGKEKDPEGMGGGGSTYDYGFRIYNPRIAKFLSVDPLAYNFPYFSPYQFAGLDPIKYIDLDGLERAYYDPYTQMIVPASDFHQHTPAPNVEYLNTLSKEEIEKRAEDNKTVLSFVPLIDIPIDGYDAINDFSNGDYLLGTLSVFSFIPGADFITKPLKQLVKRSDDIKDLVKTSGRIKKADGKLSREVIIATKTGKRTDALKVAKGAIGDLGDDAVGLPGKSTGRFPNANKTIVGVQSKDGAKGYRIDYDSEKGTHYNYWNHETGEQGAVLFEGTKDQVDQLKQQLTNTYNLPK
ncbi:RHS repeat-associated core domain-containing protein [Marivirga tractuosa]|uniref:RHS repeat-associated core domain-containing protein n=1 Tax=Marivirga tractuosa TaxID=1006 RepID=UPI0035CFBB6A